MAEPNVMERAVAHLLGVAKLDGAELATLKAQVARTTTDQETADKAAEDAAKATDDEAKAKENKR